MGNVASFLWQISYAFQQFKKFENRLRFDKVTESLKVGTFLRHSVVREFLWSTGWLLYRSADDMLVRHPNSRSASVTSADSETSRVWPSASFPPNSRASPISLTATSQRKWRNLLHTESIPLNRLRKKLSQLITSARRTAMPIYMRILSWGASGQMGEI